MEAEKSPKNLSFPFGALIINVKSSDKPDIVVLRPVFFFNFLCKLVRVRFCLNHFCIHVPKVVSSRQQRFR